MTGKDRCDEIIRLIDEALAQTADRGQMAEIRTPARPRTDECPAVNRGTRAA